MAQCILSDEREEPTTKNTPLSKENFPDKQKLREFSITKPVKELLKAGNTIEGKDQHKTNPNN